MSANKLQYTVGDPIQVTLKATNIQEKVTPGNYRVEVVYASTPEVYAEPITIGIR